VKNYKELVVWRNAHLTKLQSTMRLEISPRRIMWFDESIASRRSLHWSEYCERIGQAVDQ